MKISKKNMDISPNLTKIAVTGTSKSGKTAFLTSLLWHIDYAIKNSAFNTLHCLRDKYTAATITTDVRANKSWDRNVLKTMQSMLDEFYASPEQKEFEWAQHKNELRRGDWPEKTSNCHSFALELQHNSIYMQPGVPKWKLWKTKLLAGNPEYMFYDFPGERLLDSSVSKHEDFSAWSTEILGFLKTGSESYFTLSEKFRQVVGDTSSSACDLVEQFVALHIELRRKGKALLAPSSSQLTPEGVVIGKKNLHEAFVGLSSSQQFVPLSDKWKDTNTYRTMAENYKLYRKKLVAPIFNLVAQADVLLFLLDIPSILKGGFEKYQAICQILEHVREICNWKWAGKIAFIATQSDMVAKEDLPKLQNLLEELVDNTRSRIKAKVQCRAFVCSAIDSTQDLGGHQKQARRYNAETKEAATVTYNVPHLPTHFSAEAQGAEYEKGLPTILPVRCEGVVPPIASGLNEILEFIL